MTKDPSAFPPGVAEQLAAAHGETSPTAPSATPSGAAPKFIDGAARSTVIKLEWPVEYGGVRYHGITLKRMTVGEVEAFMNSFKSLDEAARDAVRFPVYFTEDGSSPLPGALFDGLDPDDLETLSKAAEGFLPRRFQTALAGALSPPNGASTAP